MSAHRSLALAFALGLVPCCVLGSETTPGCRKDHPEDCGQGWACRGGVCVRPTTPLSPPADASADSDAGDAASDVLEDAKPDAPDAEELG